MGAPDNLIGMKFGHLTVVDVITGNSKRMWVCKCDCGRMKEKPLSGYQLKNLIITDCGCIFRKHIGKGMRRHGQCNTKLYKVWSSMKARCSNPTDKAYANYGGRGIHVNPMWNTFEPFRDWAVCNGYREGLTLERVDNDGEYGPRNCKWIPKPEQTSNRRVCRRITYRGQTRILKDWAEELGIPYHVLQHRVYRGWSVSRAFETPVRRYG
ncbi:hypothetical protein AN477_19725 [Alicyclobacillus ferrooxydans]|uniref:AP2/ERF domain-containing protein n=1 Tax=Alicyclobacillus ferrooxydans TaxID=471514 RepID=A0A0P9ETA3_9BACL|nr:hypothetical protein AN477_19725 [Alicyclobacillus ferrooxydans]